MPQDRRTDTPLAFGALKQFLDQSPTACTPELVLIDPPPYMLRPMLVHPASGADYVSICLKHKEDLAECRFDPISFAATRLAVGLGDSLFINDNGKGKLYAKMFGQMKEKAGITVQRFICGSEGEDTAGFNTSDSLDLRVGNGRASRGMLDILAEALGCFRHDTPEELFGGAPDQRFRHYQEVLTRAIDRMHEAREAHFARRDAR
jgi:hypothetical protein